MALAPKRLTFPEHHEFSVEPGTVACLLSARYGKDANWLDASGRVLGLLTREGGIRTVKLTNSLMGGDPLPGTEKVLELSFVAGRKEAFPEHHVFSVPPGTIARVLYARYGLDSTWREVTNEASELVTSNGGINPVKLTNAVMGGDPVPKKEKTLELYFATRAGKRSLAFPEHYDFSVEPCTIANLESARYGKHSTWRDVTDKVRSLVTKDGAISRVKLTNSLMGCDPLPGTEKTLELHFVTCVSEHTVATSKYLALYNATSHATHSQQVDDVARAILLECTKIKGAAPKQDFLDMYAALRAQVDSECSTPLPGVNPVLRRVLLYWSAGPLGNPGQDKNAKFNGKATEFCSWVNLALGEGYCPELMQQAVRYVRTLNRFCNTRTTNGLEPHWGKISAVGGRLYRGGGFDPAHKAWYTHMAASKEPFRQPRGLSTTLCRHIADQFAAQAKSYGAQPVIWIIKINDTAPHCLQVNYLKDGLSMYPGEEEFLFQCRSVFFVDSVDFSSQTYIITLEAAVDNKLYCDYLPAAPRG